MREEGGRGSGVSVRTGGAVMAGQAYAAPEGGSNAPALQDGRPGIEIAGVSIPILGSARSPVYLRSPVSRDREEFLALSRSSERFYRNLARATGALSLVLRHAFDTLRLHRLEANISRATRASIALVRRAGFRREGFSRRYLKINGR